VVWREHAANDMIIFDVNDGLLAGMLKLRLPSFNSLLLLPFGQLSPSMLAPQSRSLLSALGPGKGARLGT
jgi:hypothetical protein